MNALAASCRLDAFEKSVLVIHQDILLAAFGDSVVLGYCWRCRVCHSSERIHFNEIDLRSIDSIARRCIGFFDWMKFVVKPSDIDDHGNYKKK